MRGKKPENLQFSPGPETQGGERGAAICRWLLGGMYLAGCLLALRPGWETAALLFGVYWAGYCLFGSRFRWVALGGSLLALLLGALFLRERLMLGAAAWLNPLLERLETVQGKIYLPFAAEAEAMPVFYLWAGSLLSLLTAWGVQRQTIPLWGLLAAVAAGSGLGFWSGWAGLAMAGALLGLALTWRGVAWFRGGALLLAGCLILGAALPLTNPLGALGQELAGQIAGIHPKSGVLPQGNLIHVGPLETKKTPVLELTMERPQKLYLRGFVGQRYTGRAWTRLSPEQLEGDSSLFYYLHQGDFFAQTQLGRAAARTDQGDAAALTVRSLQKSRWSYLPAGLLEFEGLDDRVFPDAGVRASQRSYTAVYQTGGLVNWYGAQGALAAGTANQDYLAQESAYRDFVYGHYLELPTATAQALGQMVGEQTQKLTLQQIQGKIRDLLTDVMTYDPAATTDCGKADFVAYTLMAQGRGYSVHYATAAACLFRYFGVPARYVEGYFLPAAEASQIPAGQTYVLRDLHAHAWAEFYLDGVGWIPFETTPGYQDQEEQTLQGLLEDPDSALHQAFNQNFLPKSFSVPQAQVQLPDEEAGQWLDGIRLAPLAFGLALLAVLALLAWQLWRLLRLRCALARLKKAPPREAVAGLYAYCRMILELSQCSWDPGLLDWEQAAADNREALFSGHPITQAQKERMLAFRGQVLRDCKARLPWPKWIFYRWIRCVF